VNAAAAQKMWAPHRTSAAREALGPQTERDVRVYEVAFRARRNLGHIGHRNARAHRPGALPRLLACRRYCTSSREEACCRERYAPSLTVARSPL
jgi:hypothetical protein